MKKTLILILFALLFTASVSAEDETQTIEEIVVTATRIEEPKKDVSSSTLIITQDDIKNSTAKDAGDLIAEAATGHVRKYPGALTGGIGLRGLSTDMFDLLKSRVLVLINGHNAGTVNLAKIPVEDIERIEIVKGPASVLYGSSAMGGVINIITKRGKEKGVHGSIGGEAGSWEYWNTQAGLKGMKDPFDFYLTASRSSGGDYKSGDNGQIDNTGYDDETVSIRLGYRFLNNHHISLGFQHWKGWDIGSPGARYSPDPDNYSDKRRNGFDIGYKTETFDTKYYLVRDKDEWYSGSGIGNSNVSSKNTDSRGMSIQKTFYIGDHRIIAGGQWDEVAVESSRNTGAPYNPNSKYDSYGIFSEGRLSLLKEKFLLSTGVRYDYFRNKILSTPGYTTLNPVAVDLDHITLRGGLVYKLTKNLSIRGNIGNAFRAPAPDELAADYVSSWGTRYLGNQDLKPEKSTSYDAGVSYYRGYLKSDFSFFHTNFRDKILGYDDSALSARTWKNIEGATLQGIEVNISYDAGLSAGFDISIEPFVNVTYNTRYSSNDETETDLYGKTLLYTPEWTGAFGMRTGGESWDVRFIVNYTGEEKVVDWNSSSPAFGQAIDKGGFTVADISGSFRPLDNLEITASLENLMGRKYEYTPGYPMPGRRYAAGLKWLF